MNSAIPARGGKRSHLYIRLGTVLVAVLLLVVAAMMWWWDHEPPPFDAAALAEAAGRLLARPPQPPATMPYTLAAMQQATLALYGEMVGDAG